MDNSISQAIAQLKTQGQNIPSNPNSAFEQFDPASISQAMGILNDKSTMGQVGKAIQTPNYAGYCLQWVDDKQGNTNRQPTAMQDYQVRQQQGQVNTSADIPKGARVYFAPDKSNGNMGHVGLYDGNGNFTAATDAGVKTFSLKDWQGLTGQQFIGWSGGNK